MAQQHQLQAAYSSLVASQALTDITNYIDAQGSAAAPQLYDIMRSSIAAWLSSGRIQTSMGLLSSDLLPPDFRFTVADATCTRLYHSPAGPNNRHENIEKLVPNDPLGARIIGHNISNRSHVIAALLGAAGVAYNTRRSLIASAKMVSMAVRIGSVNEPVGVIMMSMKA
jgi:hypothetical protein